MAKLGVNIDHIASIRRIRNGAEPQPAAAAMICEKAGCDSIVAHLREDRRHINDLDVLALSRSVKTLFNLEMSINPGIVAIACRLKPGRATIVPEKRKEITTEGGLDAVKGFRKIKKAVDKLQKNGVPVSLFIDPDKKQISAAVKLGVRMIELHTGEYSQPAGRAQRSRKLRQLKESAVFAKSLGLKVFAGHGLDYTNARAVARIKEIEEFNIGYSIICRGALAGLGEAVKQMKALLK